MRVRVTGMVIEDQRILLLDENASAGQTWSLPGGEVAEDETLTEALIRELHDDTGADVSVGRLLYVCDHLPDAVSPATNIYFVATLIGGDVGQAAVDADTTPLRGVRFVEISDLPQFGFSTTFMELALAGFPGDGSYMGATSNIGL